MLTQTPSHEPKTPPAVDSVKTRETVSRSRAQPSLTGSNQLKETFRKSELAALEGSSC